MATKEGIVSAAYILLGERPIDGFEEDTDLARTAANLYPGIVEGLMNEYPWRFLMTKVRLGQLTEKPENEWEYFHQLPSDILGSTFALFDSGDVRATPVKRWEQFGRKIASNYPNIWIDYKRAVPEGEWPGYFSELVKFEFAWQAAEPATEDEDKMSMWRRVARGETDDRGKGGYFAAATHADASGSASQGFADFDLLAARHGGVSLREG